MQRNSLASWVNNRCCCTLLFSNTQAYNVIASCISGFTPFWGKPTSNQYFRLQTHRDRAWGDTIKTKGYRSHTHGHNNAEEGFLTFSLSWSMESSAFLQEVSLPSAEENTLTIHLHNTGSWKRQHSTLIALALIHALWKANTGTTAVSYSWYHLPSQPSFHQSKVSTTV